MKLPVTKIVLVAGMMASALLLGACTSSQSLGHTSAAGSNGYAQKTGELATTWGKLPTYSLQPTDLRQFKDQFSWLPVFFAGIDNTALVDVLVDRDGTVRDVSIIESSGDPEKDSTVQPRLAGVRIMTKIAPKDPAPYVLRTLVVFSKNPWDTHISANNYFRPDHYTGEVVTHANEWLRP